MLYYFSMNLFYEKLNLQYQMYKVMYMLAHNTKKLDFLWFPVYINSDVS